MMMRFLSPYLALTLVLGGALGCPSSSGEAAQPTATEAPIAREASPERGRPIRAHDNHYGVYLNGNKVGWMRVQMRVGKRVELRTDLHAAVGGLGTVSKIRLVEQRIYDPTTDALTGLLFEQHAATGTVRAEGAVEKGQLTLTISAGGADREQTYTVQDTLSAERAAEVLAAEAIATGKAGASTVIRRFDPSIQKEVEVRHEVMALEERMFAGVSTKVVRMRTTLPALGIDETSWVDHAGRMLESKVGGFFVARLEAPDVAKKLDYSQDILVSAVVKAPRPVENPDKLESLLLTFEGFGSTLPPKAHRQNVTVKGKQVELSLRRDARPAKVPLGSAARPEDREYLASTPFIQSDSEALQKKARKIIGDAEDVYTATERISHWVFRHVRDEYIPAYSNALEALESGRGDCTEHSILFVALARAAGIPARVAVGIAYWPAGGGYGWHAWAEVRADGTWYSVDPTWDQPIADVTHVKLADGGPAEQARIVMLLGQLSIVAQSR